MRAAFVDSCSCCPWIPREIIHIWQGGKLYVPAFSHSAGSGGSPKHLTLIHQDGWALARFASHSRGNTRNFSASGEKDICGTVAPGLPGETEIRELGAG